MADNDMTVPFVLGLISGIFLLVINVLITIAGAILSSLPFGMFGGGPLFIVLGIWGIVVGILLLVGSLLMRNPDNAKVGSILVLIFGILAFFTPGLGLLVFPILAIVGGALGLSKAK